MLLLPTPAGFFFVVRRFVGEPLLGFFGAKMLRRCTPAGVFGGKGLCSTPAGVVGNVLCPAPAGVVGGKVLRRTPAGVVGGKVNRQVRCSLFETLLGFVGGKVLLVPTPAGFFGGKGVCRRQ